MSGVSAFSMMLIFTALTAYYVRTIGMSPLQLVLVGTALELTCFLFEVPTGIVADVYSRRLSLLIGGFMIAACYILEGLVPVFIGIIIAEIIRGIGETFKSGATDAWITDEVGADHVGEVFARSGQIYQICGLIGTHLIGNPSIGRAALEGFANAANDLGDDDADEHWDQALQDVTCADHKAADQQRQAPTVIVGHDPGRHFE